MTKTGLSAALQCSLLLWLASYTVGLKHHAKPAGPGILKKQKSGGARSLQTSSSARYQRPYNVCLYDWQPLVSCTGLETSQYTGYSVALWKLIAQDLGWPDSDWFFTCMDDEDSVLADLADPAGNCSVNAAGLELTWENTKFGVYNFSFPIYKSGYSVMVTNPAESSDLMFWAAPFHYIVWIMFIVTILVTALLVTLAEIVSFGSKANRQGLQGWLWYSLGKQLHFVSMVGAPKTWESRILVIGYGLVALVSMHLYTATLASKIINERLDNQINGKNDLVGKKVGAWASDVSYFRKYSIKAEPFPWEDKAHMQEMINMLRRHEYQALILDTPAVMHYTSTAPNCDLFPVGEPFDTFYVSIGFTADAPADLILNISASIVRLQTQQGMLDELENEYIMAGTSGCGYTTGDARNAEIPQIHFHQVEGLWVILGASAGVCLLWAGLKWLLNSKWGQKHIGSKHKSKVHPQNPETPGKQVVESLTSKLPSGWGANKASRFSNTNVDNAGLAQEKPQESWERSQEPGELSTVHKIDETEPAFLEGNDTDSMPGNFNMDAQAVITQGSADGSMHVGVKARSRITRETRDDQPVAGMAEPATLVGAISTLDGTG